MAKYRVTIFGLKSYKTEVLTSLEAIKKYGLKRFTESINANAFYNSMVSIKIKED
jgi:hypothetical protein